MTSLRKFSIVFLIMVSGLHHKSNADPDLDQSSNKDDILEQWKQMDKTVIKMTGSAIKMMLPQVLESAGQLNISSKCVGQGMQLVSGIRRLKLWAFKFIDSSSKMIDGILSGTFTSTGMYDQCLDSKALSKDPKKSLFVGQYCEINILPPLPPKHKNYKFNERMTELENFTGSEVISFMAERAGLLYTFPYRIGLCLPSGCNTNDIDQIVNAMTGKLYLNASVKYCEVRQDIQYSAIQIFAIVFSAILSIIVLLGTSFEVFYVKEGMILDGIGCKLLLSFSVISNFKKIFSTKTSADNLKCIHGIRFLSITMVVMGHSYLFPLFMLHMYQSLLHVNSMMRKPMSQFIMNSHVVVDSFFLVSGLLVCYLTMNQVRTNKKKLNVKSFILHRLWRLAPVYYFIILMSMLIPLMGSGPNFREAMAFFINGCHKYWWTNLLFINNFFDFDEMCMIHTWYVSCDFQLYISTLIVLLPLIRSQKAGIAINITIIVTSILYSGFITYYYDLIPGLYLEYIDKYLRAESFLKTYANPLTHAGPYFIGVFVGYALVKNPDIKMSKKCQAAGWFLAILCSGYTMLWTSFWDLYTPSLLETSIFSGLYKSTWAAALGWMIFCCITGHGGFINKFLSWSAWVPLAKLAFLIYLIQPILQSMYIAVFKSTHEFRHFELIIIYFGMVIMAGLLALVTTLLIESPLMAIEKIFLGKKKETEEIDSEINVEKLGNGHLNTENRNLELNDFSSGVDNITFDKTS